MFGFLKDIFAFVLGYIYGLVGNPGLSIILLTLLVQVLIFPLTKKQLESTQKMSRLNPEIKKIQEKYKKNPEKQNKAMQELFQKHNYNPFSGCLPMIIQLPIIIGIFELLKDAELVNSIMPQVNFLIWNLVETDSTYILPVIAAGLTFLQQWLTMAKQPQQNQQMKMMMYIFPALILFFSLSFPSGLVIYWIMNSLAMITSNYIINRKTEVKVEKAS